MVTVFCNQSSTERTHNAGDIRANDLYPGNLLEGAENCLIVEGSTLNDNMSSKFCRIG